MMYMHSDKAINCGALANKLFIKVDHRAWECTITHEGIDHPAILMPVSLEDLKDTEKMKKQMFVGFEPGLCFLEDDDWFTKVSEKEVSAELKLKSNLRKLSEIFYTECYKK